MLKKDQLPGILLCAVLTVPAWILGQLVPVVGGPVFAILLGIILALTPFNVVAALLFPSPGDAIGLSNEGFGLLWGQS